MGRKNRLMHGCRVALLLGCVLTTGLFAGDAANDVMTALDRQDAWLETSSEGAGWQQFLMTDVLRAELAKGEQADGRVIAQVLGLYESGTPGLDSALFVTTREAIRRFADDAAIPQSVRWAELARSHAQKTAPISEAMLGRARKNLVDSANSLETYLMTADTETLNGWKKFLSWDDLQEQMSSDSPDWKVLNAVGGRFFDGHPGLEFPEFVRVREALRTYLYMGELGSNGAGQKAISAQLEALATTLDKYNETPTTKNAAEVATLLGWLKQLEQIPSLVAQIRARHMNANIKLRVSENLLSRRFSQAVNEPTLVNEMILGTHVRGQGVTTGTITADIVPDASVARIDIVFRGKTNTNSLGRQKPVTIRSTSVTALEARKPLFIYPRSITAGPSVATGRTSTTIHSITPDRKLGSRFIEKIAWKRAGSQKAQSQQIASGRAARRLEKQVDEKSIELLTRAQEALREQLRGPINSRGLIPEHIKTHSLDDSLIVMATQADSSQFGATTTPPAFCLHDDVVAQVHESAINNTAEKALAGLTLTDERIAELTEKITGSVPEELVITEDSEPWSISFDWQQPFTIEFDDQKMKIAVRGRKFTSGDRALNKVMEMSATYGMQATPEGVLLTREGEIDVRFPGLAEDARLKTLDRVFKTLMQKKFSELFKPTIQGEGFSLPGRFKDLGTIRLNDLSADDGWLSLGWK